ncbi:hypothetical protein HPP92_024901 [Vanilla planifolia]|uniref:Uncharacterized protein n=1 Tax=Vanilla planifolia TaxID=51239 RepID=A0A835PNZ4_VANPL|nr:hypothetical protein HPP92_025184 [Vanilla planifolia]KAG0453597.1 hypothetical protein HPP92_024901 [Vanilla planifolia]
MAESHGRTVVLHPPAPVLELSSGFPYCSRPTATFSTTAPFLSSSASQPLVSILLPTQTQWNSPSDPLLAPPP